MGNFINRLVNRCFGLVCSRKKYLKTRYQVEGDKSIEFETLIDEESHDEMSRLLTDHEKQLLKSRQFDAIVHEQTKIDMELDHQLAKREDELRREEEAFLDAKREAARIAKLQRAKEKAAQKNATVNGSRSWLGDDDEWEVAGGEDDFELFLASVKARSVAARAQVHAPQGGGQDTSSLTAEKSLTEAATLELEWDESDGQ